jgi:Flp pilus assembly protein TadG
MQFTRHLENSPGRRRVKVRGNAIVETTLMLPWIFFLFVAILDFGFYSYAATGLQNAANAAALVTGGNAGTAGATSIACTYAIQELAAMPNSGDFDLATCIAGTNTTLSATATPVTVGALQATQVRVTYQSIPMVPIPGLMMGRLTLSRQVIVPVYGES